MCLEGAPRRRPEAIGSRGVHTDSDTNVRAYKIFKKKTEERRSKCHSVAPSQTGERQTVLLVATHNFTTYIRLADQDIVLGNRLTSA